MKSPSAGSCGFKSATTRSGENSFKQNRKGVQKWTSLLFSARGCCAIAVHSGLNNLLGIASCFFKAEMKEKIKWISCVLIAAFGFLQFTNPARTNPPVVNDLMATNAPPPRVAALLHHACYDCHSYETKWPWYSRIAPISWLIADDVNEGRKNLNLSDWPTDNPARAAKRLENMSEEIDYQEMPPQKYTMIHADARLTAAGRKELIDWLDAEAARLRALSQK
jgi:hypothetical protein